MKQQGAEAPIHAAKHASSMCEASDRYGQVVWCVCHSHLFASVVSLIFGAPSQGSGAYANA